MSEMNAKILLWGIAGSGKTTTVQTIHDKLRADLRSDVRHQPTRLDPTVRYESLAITLGDVGGIGTQIEIVAVPGAPELNMTRKQLLDNVDGLVLVLDCSPERIDHNRAAIAELRESLEAYGRTLDSLPTVLQYNKRDLADPFAIEELHRRLGLSQSAVFETIATTGHGILATLTTISKHVVRTRRGMAATPNAATPVPVASAKTPVARAVTEPEEMLVAQPFAELDPAGSPDSSMASYELLEAAILAEGEAETEEHLSVDADFELPGDLSQDLSNAFSEDPAQSKPESLLGADIRIVSVGQPTVTADGGLRLPIVLGDAAGQTRGVVLSLRLDALTSTGDD